MLALVQLFTFVSLFPCFVFGSMLRHRKHLNSEQAIARAPHWLRHRFYYFYCSFKHEYFMWEAVGFVHKALLAIIAAKAEVARRPGVPLFIASWVVLSQFVLEMRYKAYKRKFEENLILITLFGMLALTLAAQGLAIATLDSDPDFQGATRIVAGICMISVMAYFAIICFSAKTPEPP